MVAPTQNREFRERRIRVKDDTAADDPAAWTYIDPESFTVTVGGTATDGNYIVTVVPEAPPSGTTTIPISFERAAAETNTQIGAGIDAAADTLFAATSSVKGSVLSDYLQSVSNASGVVTFIGRPDPFCAYTVTLTAPAPGTLTLAPDDTFPITFSSLGFGPIGGAKTYLELVIVPVDSSGVPLDPNGATIDVTYLRVIDRSSTTQVGGAVPPGVGASVTEDDLPIGSVARIAYNGGRLGFRLSGFLGTITGLDAFELWIREVTG